MADAVFVDTNVLLYEWDRSHAAKQQRALEWMSHLWTSRRGRVSFQVLSEFYAVATQKLKGMTREAAQRNVRTLLAWRPIAIEADVLALAWDTQRRTQLAWWDALVVGAARAARCRYLLSEDFQVGAELAGVRVVSPFETNPDQLG